MGGRGRFISLLFQLYLRREYCSVLLSEILIPGIVLFFEFLFDDGAYL